MLRINRILSSVRKEGLVRALDLLIKRAIKKIIKKEIVFVWRDSNDERTYLGNSGFEVFSKTFNKKEISGMLGQDISEKAKSRIENGDILVCLFFDKILAGYGWGRYQSSLYFSYVSNGIDLEKEIFYIYDCFTYPEFRGKGVYPLVLAKLCEVADRSEVYVACQSLNESSIKGILKAGFERFKDFVLVDFYFFRFKFVLLPKDRK